MVRRWSVMGRVAVRGAGKGEGRDARSELGITYYKELWVVGEKRWG